MHILFSVPQQLLKGTGGVVVEPREDVAHPLHPVLRGHGDGNETAEETAVRAEAGGEGGRGGRAGARGGGGGG